MLAFTLQKLYKSDLLQTNTNIDRGIQIKLIGTSIYDGDFKRLRKTSTAKISRLRTNRDLLNSLLVSSDPVISTYRPLPKKKEKKEKDLPSEILNLLQFQKNKVYDEEESDAVERSDIEDEFLLNS